MEPIEFNNIRTKDGLQLRVTSNHIKDPKAALLIIHGFGEHIDRYNHVYEYFGKSNILCIGMDLRGHGKSEGSRGHAPSYDLLMDDIEELMKSFRAEWNEIPMFLFGHSMGGNLVTNFVIRRPQNELTGFIASSPWLKLSFEPPKWKVQAGNVLSSVLPGLKIDSELDTTFLSKDEAVVKAYEDDPLVLSKISAGLFQMISKSGIYALDNKDKVTLNGLIYHGDADQITSHEATHQFTKDNEHISWISYPGVYHEGHNDLEKDEILSNLKNWIEDHL